MKIKFYKYLLIVLLVNYCFGASAQLSEVVINQKEVDYSKFKPMPLPKWKPPLTNNHINKIVSYNIGTGIEEITEINSSIPTSNFVTGSSDVNNTSEEIMLKNFTNLTQITSPSSFPYCVNAKIFMTFPNGLQYEGSCTFFDSRTALTAGHCVYSAIDGGWATSIEVIPAYSNGTRPFGSSFSISLSSFTGWTQNSDYDWDMGVIKLGRPIGALTSWLGYAYDDNNSFFTGNTFHNAGYPAESPYNGSYMYYWYGTIDNVYTHQLLINKYSYGGQSGSGFYNKDASNNRYLYGELSNGDATTTNFVRINVSKHNWMTGNVDAITPGSYDLIPLNVSASPSSINAGDQFTAFNFLVHNYSSVAWSGSVSAKVYLSTNTTISTSDVLLGTFNYSLNISSKSSITCTTLPQIPITTSSGTYYLGVILDNADYNTGNNITSTQDVAEVYVSAVTYCSGLTSLTNLTGSFSDGSGSNDYGINSDCYWLIEPAGASSITLSFSSFSTESNYDYVSVYDGNSTLSTLLGQFSGTTLPSNITSSGGSMFVNFTTDGSVVSQGWDASYSSIVAIDWCNFQWPPSGTITVGTSYNVYAQAYKAGLTEAAGQGAGIYAWIGYSTTDTDPSTWTNWVTASYNTDAGNNDEYFVDIGSILTVPGTYYLASCFYIYNGGYIYGGYSGIWNGTTNVNAVLTVLPPNLDCSNSINLSCGQTYSGTNNASQSNVSFYSLLNWNESGPEVVHTITIYESGDLTASLSNMTGDLNIFILSDCNENHCVAYGSVLATYTNAPPGTYYIVVDGYNGAVGNYDLTISCPHYLDCSGSVYLGCGQTYSGTNSIGLSNVSVYSSSGWDESGPEVVHIINIYNSGDLTATLSNMTGGDLDVFILSDCNENNIVAYGDNSATYSNAPAGTYYIVVDGYYGAISNYDLIVNCPIEIMDCNNAVVLSCNQSYNGSTAFATLYNTNFDNGGSWPIGWAVSGGGTQYTTSTTSASSGYTGSSGSYNVNNGTNSTATLIYNNSLSTIGYTNIMVQWGARKTSTGTSPSFYWSTNGSTWNLVNFTDVSNNSTWGLVNGGIGINLPTGAEGVGNLQFKWLSNSGTGTYRIDDFSITAIYIGGNSNVSYYSCWPYWNEQGSENVHKITTNATGNLIVSLSNLSTDLDVFILNACNSMNCIGFGDNTDTIYNAPPATYYIIVDGYAGNVGSYTLTVNCPSSASLPIVSTTQVSAITSSSATSGGSVTSDGGSLVTEKGVCWSTNSLPSIFDNTLPNGTGIGSYMSTILGLSSNTGYHIRAYATNDVGTAYGNDLFFTTLQSGFIVSGALNYNNSAYTPIANTTINLLSGTTQVATTVTNLGGNFSINNIANGSYTLTVSTSKPWGGVTATDALKMKRHIVGLELLTEPIRLTAADANNSNTITATDVLKVQRRIVGLDVSFTRADWNFEKPTIGGNSIIVNNADVTQNMFALCTGDVNGSYILTMVKQNNNYLTLQNESRIEIDVNKEFYLPVKVANPIEIGAFQLFLNYNSNIFDVIDVTMNNSNEDLIFNIQNGEIKIVWANINPISLNTNDVLLKLKMKAKSTTTLNTDISLNDESELSNSIGNIIENAKLLIPTISFNDINSIAQNDSDNFEFSIYPNPVKNELTIETNFSAKQKCKILNVLGEVVYTLTVNKTTIFNTSKLKSGVYFVKIYTDKLSVVKKFVKD